MVPPPGQFSQFIWQVLAETGVPSLGQISNSYIGPTGTTHHFVAWIHKNEL